MNSKTFILILISILCLQVYSQHVGIEENNVGQNILIKSNILEEEREVQVYLPASYTQSKDNYPVLYVLDGQRYFLHGVSLQKSFADFKQAPDFVVVGITKKRADRNRNYSTNSAAFLNFIEQELIPYIDSTFRTSQVRLLFGWAYAGGFAINSMLTKPDLFDAYIAASAFPLSQRISKIDRFLTQQVDLNTYLYFTSGTKEGIVKEGTAKLAALLNGKAPKALDWTFRELQGEEHRSTPFTTLYHGIRNYYQYYPELQFSNIEEFNESGGLRYVYDYYERRAKQFGFPAELTDWTMFSLTRNAIRDENFKQFESLVNEFRETDFLGRLRVRRACSIAEFYIKNKQYEKAIDIFEFLSGKHPASGNPLTGLGDSYKAMGDDKKAAAYYKRAEALYKKSSN
ncbi:MAG: alpha/beta hydrolase-fold protein [Calditrichia bacterium]